MLYLLANPNASSRSTGAVFYANNDTVASSYAMLEVENTQRFKLDGSGNAFLTAPAAAAADGLLATSSVHFWVNEATNALTFKVKYSNGTTVKSGTVALA